jgi:hypothetical protein
VFWATAEDLLCITRHLLLDLNYRPELLIVGVETWTFKPPTDEHPAFPGVRRRLLNVPQLAVHHPDINRLLIPWSQFADCFSRQQLALSWRLLRDDRAARETYPPLAEHKLFQRDGTRVFYGDLYGKRWDTNIFTDTEAGQYPITRYLEDAAKSDRPDAFVNYANYDFDGLWAPRVRYFQQFVSLCTSQDVRMVFVINPVHPVFREVIRRRTPHLKNQKQLQGLLEKVQATSSAVLGVVDASRIESFNGDPQGFYDGIHYATGNADLILEQVVKLIPNQ